MWAGTSPDGDPMVLACLDAHSLTMQHRGETKAHRNIHIGKSTMHIFTWIIVYEVVMEERAQR